MIVLYIYIFLSHLFLLTSCLSQGGSNLFESIRFAFEIPMCFVVIYLSVHLYCAPYVDIFVQ